VTKLAVLGAIAIFFAACSGGDDSNGANNTNGGDGGGSGNGGDGSTANGGDGGPPADSCEAFGHFGTPSVTFVLPAQGSGANATLAYDDVQKSFPSVDWANLDRLYLPAGKYLSLQLGNLPLRDPSHPLVITNQGGQVFVGNNPNGNYIWSMGGACDASPCTSVSSGWILTGRYDPDSKTGDVGFQGHRCGKYASSQDTYGIVSDDDFALKAPYLHMGLGVQGATKFEIEYVEVRRSGFAGIRLINSRASGDPAQPMADVKVHDVYVHDTAGEGFYFGWTGDPPSNLFPGLEIYNSRIVRTGNEALQIQDLGDGSHIYSNVFASGGMHWLDNGLGLYQDNVSQIMVRTGSVEIDHNVLIDGAATLANFFAEPAATDGDGDMHVTFHDNHFADSLNIAVAINDTPTAASSFAFTNNSFRGFTYGYSIISGKNTPPATLFGVNVTAPVSLTGNTWEGSAQLASAASNVTLTNDTNATVPPLAFVNAGYPVDQPGHHLTWWAPNATVVSGSPAVTYHANDVVAEGDGPDFYQAITDTTAGPPSAHTEAWKKLSAPVDDLRAVPGSPYAAIGIK
jgi:hypothetical protein